MVTFLLKKEIDSEVCLAIIYLMLGYLGAASHALLKTPENGGAILTVVTAHLFWIVRVAGCQSSFLFKAARSFERYRAWDWGILLSEKRSGDKKTTHAEIRACHSPTFVES